MAQKTRGGFLTHFIILGVVVTLGYIVVVIVGREPKNQCTYLMTVTFNPTPQEPQVSIGYSINGGTTKWTKESNSPWVKPVPARCGSVIVLTASVDPKYSIRKIGSNSLNCSIQHGNKSYGDSAEPGELSVHCAVG